LVDADGFKVGFVGGEFGAIFAEVVVEDDAGGVGAIAMEADEDVKASFGATE
jgi:hypothetical protein